MRLSKYLYESLLDDEEELIDTGDDSAYDNYRGQILNCLRDRNFTRNTSFNSLYIIDNLDKGGDYTLCPCQLRKTDFEKSLSDPDFKYIKRLTTKCFSSELGYSGSAGKDRVFSGNMEITGDVGNCPDKIKIGPISGMSIRNGKVPQNLIPEFCVQMYVKDTDCIAGLNLSCRLVLIKKLGANKKPININIAGNYLGKMSGISIMDVDLRSWSQLNFIKSNTHDLKLYDTDLANDIINKYYDTITANRNNRMLEFKDAEFEKILKNFPDLKEVTLAVDFVLSKEFNKSWVIHYLG